MIKLFRSLVVVSSLSYFLFLGSWYLFTPYLSEDVLAVLTWTGYGAIIQLPPFVSWALVLFWLLIAIGMYFFNSTARLLYLVFTIFFILTTPLYGLFVSTAYDLVFLEITNFLDGAILAMAYLSSISAKFKNA